MPSDRQEAISQGGRELARWLEERRDRILAAWRAAARQLPKARLLEHPVLQNNIPDLLEDVAAAAREQGATSRPRFPERTPVAHALDRLERGFDLEEVIEEYAALRACVLDALADVPAGPRECAFVDRAIDAAMTRAVTAFATARDRTLRALDHIVQASGETDDLEGFLSRLLAVLVQTDPAVDAAAVLLWEEERLRARAAIGLEEDVRGRFSAGLGEGFVGRVAAERAPVALRAAAADPSVRMESIRARGIRALYGVPLLDGDALVGVALMGSTMAWEFSDEDKLLFRSLATRATVFIQRARTLDSERAAREALQLQSERLRRSEQALARAITFRDRLLAIVGHDLRNPLGAVRLGAGLLAKRAASPENAATAERIGRSAARMERIIADLVDVAGARYGEGIPVSRRSIDAAEVLAHVVHEHQLTHPDRTIALEVSGDARADLDPDRFAQVATNLLSNALSYGSPSTPVRVALTGGADALSLEVHNDGPPIPAENLPELFEPFRRGRHESGNGRGLGLGLFIVSELVRAHGGDVRAASTAEAGTTFTVRLPRRARP